MACLLLDPPPEPLHAVVLALKARNMSGHLARAVDAQGQTHPVRQGFAGHLREHLLIPSGRGGGHGGARAVAAPGGCFTYEPPPGVVWAGEQGLSLK